MAGLACQINNAWSVQRRFDGGPLSADRQLPAEPAVVVGGPNGSKQLTESPSLAEIQAAIAQAQ